VSRAAVAKIVETTENNVRIMEGLRITGFLRLQRALEGQERASTRAGLHRWLKGAMGHAKLQKLEDSHREELRLKMQDEFKIRNLEAREVP